MKRGFYIFLVFVFAVLVSNRVLIDAVDKGIYNEKNLKTDTADDEHIHSKTNPKTAHDEENPNKLKRKRKKKNEDNNDDLKGIERIHSHLLFMVCDYLHIDDTSRFHRTSTIIHEKLLIAHASVHEIALHQFMRMVRAPPLNSPLYNTIGRKFADNIKRKFGYTLVDKKQYQLMKRYQRFVTKTKMLSKRMKNNMADILSTSILPPLYSITFNSSHFTFRYLYLKQIEDINKFSFKMQDGESHFAPVPKGNDDGASKLIPHLNDVPLNVLFLFDVWTTMCYLRKPNTKEFISFRYNMPAFFTTEKNPNRRSRHAEHYIHFWNHKIAKIVIVKDADIIALALVHGNRSYFAIGLEILNETVTIEHHYWKKDGTHGFYEREYDTIFFPKFN